MVLSTPIKLVASVIIDPTGKRKRGKDTSSINDAERYLLLGANPEDRDEDGWSCLAYAAGASCCDA